MTNYLANDEVRDNIGEFLDEYIHLESGEQLPRNIPYFKEAIGVLLQTGMFKSVYDIKMACLTKKKQMIPDFLFGDAQTPS